MKPPADPDPNWESFAAREPYFAVLTAPRFLRANLTPDHEREFFASGEHLVQWMLNVIDAGLSPHFAPASMLEYGCGLGRLALPLAERPGAVTAVDRSPVMLELARGHAERRNLGHISFQTPPEFFSKPRKFDLVVCYQVLQRLRPGDAMALLDQLIERISPNGVGVFQWPLPTRESGLVSSSRWIRENVPGANTVANKLRGKDTDDPFIPTHAYALDEILPVFQRSGFRSTHVVLEPHENVDYAIVLAQRAERATKTFGHALKPARQAASLKPQAVSDAELDDFNKAAEVYFASLSGWDHHLAKPFSNPDETPTILGSLATLLQALHLTPGMRVLEFGAGSGWLSHFLTEMGCSVVLLDVAPTALEIARELYRRQPAIGDRPAPEFLLFNGRTIDLPDASVDRVICFDAFHHAPNPDDVIREFGRVLVPGGVAGFAEPGPRHAEAPKSQFESHTYGVVELDVDVHALWRTAQASGFSDLRMCVFHGTPYQVSLEEYEDLLAGGEAQEAWSASTRKFLRYVRNFTLIKAGADRADSRTAAGLACTIRANLVTPEPTAGRPILVDTTVTNTGVATWLPSGSGRGGVALGTHLHDAGGALLNFDFHTEPLTDPPRPIPTGETVRCRVTLPALTAGTYRLELDCVAANVTWFAQTGSHPSTLTIEVNS
jgi:SAM-dependent methyltransferase